MFLESKLSLQIACKFPKPWIVISDHLELREQKRKNYTIFILTTPVYTCKAALRLSNKHSYSSFLFSEFSMITDDNSLDSNFVYLQLYNKHWHSSQTWCVHIQL